MQEIVKAYGIDFTRPVQLGYTGLSDALLCKYISDSRSIWEQGLETLRYTSIGSVIGTHAGPGAIAVAFFKNRCGKRPVSPRRSTSRRSPHPFLPSSQEGI